MTGPRATKRGPRFGHWAAATAIPGVYVNKVTYPSSKYVFVVFTSASSVFSCLLQNVQVQLVQEQLEVTARAAADCMDTDSLHVRGEGSQMTDDTNVQESAEMDCV